MGPPGLGLEMYRPAEEPCRPQEWLGTVGCVMPRPCRIYSIMQTLHFVLAEQHQHLPPCTVLHPMQARVVLCRHLLCCPHRSTFPGAGRFAGHWTGDNGASWQDFVASTASILASNMWGIPIVGADICGFVDMEAYNGTAMDPPKFKLSDGNYQELCNRWAGRVVGGGGR